MAAQSQLDLGSSGGQLQESPRESRKPTEEKDHVAEAKEEQPATAGGKTEDGSEGDEGTSQENCKLKSA